MRDWKAKKDVAHIHQLMIRAQSWGFGTSAVERSSLCSKVICLLIHKHFVCQNKVPKVLDKKTDIANGIDE